MENLDLKIKENPFSCTYYWVINWINDHLKLLPPNSLFVELGTFVGGTTRLISLSNPTLQIYTIDDYEYLDINNSKLFNAIKHAYNLSVVDKKILLEIQKKHLSDLTNVTKFIGKSRSVPVKNNVSASFVDAGHSYVEVLQDLNFIWNHTIDNGYIFGDDIDSPEVFNAINTFSKAKNVEFEIFSKAFKIIKKPKK